jgi:hypothetical protein
LWLRAEDRRRSPKIATTVGSGTTTFSGPVAGLGALTVSSSGTANFSSPAPVPVSASSADVAGTLAGSAFRLVNDSGNYTQEPGSTLNVKLGGLTAGTQYDQVNAAGAIALAGTLNLSLVGGYVPSAGQTFTLVQETGPSSITGTFAGLPNGAQLTLGATLFQINYTGSAVVLTDLNTPPSNLVLGTSAPSLGEGSTLTLGGTFTDPDTNQTHTVVINWGDGSANTTVNLAAGVTSFSGISHLYVEASTGQPGGSYPIAVTVTDSYGTSTSANASVQVNDDPLGSTGATVTGIEGIPSTGVVVATFTDANPYGTAADFSAAIKWGDGTSSAGTILTGPNATFYVVGSHTYPEEGNAIPVTVTIADAGGAGTVAHGTATIADAPLTATGTTVTPVTGTSFTGAVATFTDADAGGTAADYTATITWGNGNTTAGTVAASGSGFTVTGSTTYAADGVDAITVTIQDAGGSGATAHSTAYVGGLATHLGVTAGTAQTAGTPFALTVTALDAAGHPAYSYAGTVHFTSSDARAVLPANYPFSAGDLGTHVFSVTLKTAGTQSVTATDTARVTITGKQAGIVVSPGAVSQFQVVSSVSKVTAGTALSVTVTAQDAYGNTVTGYRGTVHFTSTDGQAVLPANYPFTATDAGKHTFSVTLKTAGSQTVTLTDTANGAVTGTSGAITVNPAAATHFRISAPASVTHGVAFAFTVTALDAYGNVATGYLGTVTFTSSDGKAKLPPNYTFTSANAGVVTLQATLNSVGVQSLTATDTKTKSITGTDGSIQVS